MVIVSGYLEANSNKVFPCNFQRTVLFGPNIRFRAMIIFRPTLVLKVGADVSYTGKRRTYRFSPTIGSRNDHQAYFHHPCTDFLLMVGSGEVCWKGYDYILNG